MHYNVYEHELLDDIPAWGSENTALAHTVPGVERHNDFYLLHVWGGMVDL